MDYQVPQFIEEETKIVGPLTFKQFFIFFGAGITSFIIYFLFETWLWAIFTSVIAVATIGISFGRIRGRPVSGIILQALKFFWEPRFYIWKKPSFSAEELFVEKEKKVAKPATAPTQTATSKVLTPEKIKELAQQLDKKSN